MWNYHSTDLFANWPYSLRSEITQENKASIRLCVTEIEGAMAGGRFRWEVSGRSTTRMLRCISAPSERQFAGTGEDKLPKEWLERRRAPVPSLLQMDIIKPLAGEWGLMTPSGPILGLNKRWKIKLRSKLQPACSRAVYQQCVRNQREKRREGRFSYSSVVLLLFLACYSFISKGREDTLYSGSAPSASCRRSWSRILNEGDDLRWNIQGWGLKGLSLCLQHLLYLSSPQLSHISRLREAGGVNQVGHHSLCPRLWEPRRRQHKCSGKQSRPQWLHIYSHYLLHLVDVWVIRHRSLAGLLFTDLRTWFNGESKGEILLQWLPAVRLLGLNCCTLPSDIGGITHTLHLDRAK